MKRILSFFKSDVGRIIVSGIFFVMGLSFPESYKNVKLALYLLSLAFCGLPVFMGAVRGILRRDLLDEKFLMSVASIGAFFVGEWSEGVAVMLFFLIGETFEHSAVRRSRNSIRALMSIRPDEATLFNDGAEETVYADDVEVGSVIVISPGERVPLDCQVISGASEIDTSAMTGESIPRSVTVGDTIDSGVVVLSGRLIARTLRVAEDSAASRILELVENANENKSKEETFITKFSHYYTPIVVGLAVAIAVLLPLLRLATLESAIYRAMMFLVISCPCALVISVPMAFFGGIGGAASLGILFKGGNVFSTVARADTFAFDKTGTLTTGKITVSDVECVGISRDELLLLASSAEQGSNHPIAVAIASLTDEHLPIESLDEIAGEGIIARISGRSVAVGNEKLMKRIGAEFTVKDGTAALVAVDGRACGIVTLTDSVRAEAASAIAELKRLGARRVTMLSGDRPGAAVSVGEKVGIKEVYHSLTPEEKYSKLNEIKRESGKALYVGDGINDSPALAISDVGIAMGGIGQDSAKEAADIVIMADDLSMIPLSVRIARRTVGIAKFNIAFALLVKLLIMLLGAFNIADMWLAVFADVGVAVLAILNSMRTLIRPTSSVRIPKFISNRR